jgi:hypothetical protein
MFHQTEAKFQTWRALAVFADGSECLLFVGRSTTHVRAGYAAACAELLDEEEHARLARIKLQCWEGAADRGHWILMGELPVPARKPAAKTAPADETPALLPFRQREKAPALAGAAPARKLALGN